ASEASGSAERLGDPVTRSYGYDVLCLTAFAAGDWDDAADWARRRVSLVDEIDDPDHQQDIYSGAFAPVVARGQFDEGRRYARSVTEITRRLSPHHRLHGVGQIQVLEELLGDWGAVSRLQPRDVRRHGVFNARLQSAHCPPVTDCSLALKTPWRRTSRRHAF